jgi:hypothetical protein
MSGFAVGLRRWAGRMGRVVYGCGREIDVAAMVGGSCPDGPDGLDRVECRV